MQRRFGRCWTQPLHFALDSLLKLFVPELTKAGYFELMFLNRGRFLCMCHMAPNVPRDPSGNRSKSQIDLKHLYNKGYSVMQKKTHSAAAFLSSGWLHWKLSISSSIINALIRLPLTAASWRMEGLHYFPTYEERTEKLRLCTYVQLFIFILLKKHNLENYVSSKSKN